MNPDLARRPITSIAIPIPRCVGWGAARMSWWLTMLLHRFPDETPFEQQMRLNQFDYLLASEHAQASLAEQYVGLPYED
jgi:p-hydroxybenzoate 3-monooxygenase